jgi:hypothetical protein
MNASLQNPPKPIGVSEPDKIHLAGNDHRMDDCCEDKCRYARLSGDQALPVGKPAQAKNNQG